MEKPKRYADELREYLLVDTANLLKHSKIAVLSAEIAGNNVDIITFEFQGERYAGLVRKGEGLVSYRSLTHGSGDKSAKV